MNDLPDYVWPRAEFKDLHAMWHGQADADTQRRVVKHIVEVLGRVNGSSLVPGSPDLTAFMEGRRWVARQLQNALTLPMERICQPEDTNAGSNGTGPNPVVSAARAAVERTKSRGRAARAVERT
jgi:hypothetical protein